MYSIDTFYDHFVVCKDGKILYHTDNKKQAQDDIKEMEVNTEIERNIISCNKSNKNYIVYHLHDDNSLLDSCTKHNQYIDKAVELGQKAICFTNHGNIHNWIEKKMYCDKVGIKYMLGVECYMTETLDEKIRDNYHTILISKNKKGREELLRLMFNATNKEHKYYKPRISFDEFLNISDNIIKISSCLASPLNKIRDLNRVERLFKHYDYYEIQYHNCQDQIEYNQYLYDMSKKYNKPLIIGTDTHSLNTYMAECRKVLQMGKDAEFSKGDSDGSNEDEFDMTYKSYDELVECFRIQNSLPMDVILEAIENTNIMADMVEDFELDTSIKYPILYEDDEKVMWDTLKKKYKYKLDNGIIKENQRYIDDIKEEMRVFKKTDMVGFMLFMSELMTWCRDNNIYTSPCRGSVGGSTVAYISDITDVDPIIWDTVFSRFCNEDRKEIGDIDIDVHKDKRQLVYDYIINRFGKDKTSYILSSGTVVGKGTIDIIGKFLRKKWAREQCRGLDNFKQESEKMEKSQDNPYRLSIIKEIKTVFDTDEAYAREEYKDIFYYFDGILNTKVSQSQHPAGIIASPINLIDNYGGFIGDDEQYILPINMEEVHEIGLAKYDILGLRNIGIVEKTCEYANIKPPLSHEINWNDMNVFNNILKSQIGVFQFEGDYSYKLLCDYLELKMSQGKQPTVADFTLINASLRPSGESYRDKLIQGEFNKNPSVIIDKLLEDTQGWLVYQEQTLLFLQQICGLSGSEADNVRRAIGRKQMDRLQDAMPSILEGYCNMSNQPRDIAEEEAKQFLQIIEDSSNYQFGKNHATGYSLLAYILIYLRCYHLTEFCCGYLNCSETEDDILDGTKLAINSGIKISSIKFGKSKSDFAPDSENKIIYKGLNSIKDIGKGIGDQLFTLSNNHYPNFFTLLSDIKNQTKLNSKQLSILIKLDYFSQFGHPHQLIEQVKVFDEISALFNKFNTCKQLSKSDLILPIDEVEKCCAKSTEKMFKEIDNDKLVSLFRKHYPKVLKQISAKYPYSETTIMDKLKYEVELLGYTDLTDKTVNEDYYIITKVEVNNYGTTFIDLYQISSGIQKTTKVNKQWLKEYPIKQGDILKCAFELKRKGRYVEIDGKKKWVTTDEWEEKLETYCII